MVRVIPTKKVEFFPYEEGLCVQCMHIGSYDDEPATIKSMTDYAQRQGYQIAIDSYRRHHEIYLSDPRKTSADKLKTVIRYFALFRCSANEKVLCVVSILHYPFCSI